MKPEHDERFRRIADDYLDRPGGDYAELLARGEVSSADGVDPEQWRAEIRAKARADEIRVITPGRGTGRSRGAGLASPRTRSSKRCPRRCSAAKRSAAAEQARQLGHEIVRWVASGEHRDVPPLPRPAVCPA